MFCRKDIKFRSWQTGLEKVQVALNAHPKLFLAPIFVYSRSIFLGHFWFKLATEDN